MLYLATPPPPERVGYYRTHHIGVMVTFGTYRKHSSTEWPYFALDNGCFTRPDKYDDDAYLSWLGGFRGSLFATAPDVVGDWRATLDRSIPMLARIRDTGHRAAIVVQEGVTVGTVPWANVDAVFIGGGNDFKTAPETHAVVVEARRRGLWTHMGRVNTWRRIRQAAEIGCHSVDGTLVAFGPDVHLPRLSEWMRRVRTEPQLEGLER